MGAGGRPSGAEETRAEGGRLGARRRRADEGRTGERRGRRGDPGAPGHSPEISAWGTSLRLKPLVP